MATLAQTFDLALKNLHSGNHQQAEALYRQILQVDPQHVDAWHLLGLLAEKFGRHDLALEYIGQALRLRPNFSVAHNSLGTVFQNQGRLEEAAARYQEALRLEPDLAEAHSNLGKVLKDQGKLEEAAASYQKALRLKPDNSAVHYNLGNILNGLGKREEAINHYQQALRLKPDFFQAHNNLGNILKDQGKLEEAAASFQKALGLKPDFITAHYNLGNVLTDLGKLEEALASYQQTLNLQPDFFQAHNNMGTIFKNQGKLEAAIVSYQRALHLRPDFFEAHNNLGFALQKQGKLEEAVTCYRQALHFQPNCVEALNNLGLTLQEQGKREEAAEHFRTALGLQPDYAVAQMNLGGLHEELGEMAEAEAAFREAIRLQSAFALAHARLATLLRGKLPDADRAGLEEQLANPKLEDDTRARLLFSLAQVLDSRAEYSRAADCLRQANALSLEQNRRQQRTYVPAEHERFVTDLMQAFGQDFFARTAGAGLETRRPVFVFGLPRSGTTLIEQVLASHSRVHGAGELHLARQTFEAIPAVVERTEGPLPCVPYLNAAAVRRLAEQHLAALQEQDNGRAERVVDKMPDNYMYLGLLAALFPSAVFIHFRRDLRDVAVSCWMTDFHSILWANDPEHIATRFHQYRRLMEHWRAVLPVSILEVDYENAVADLEGVARRLLEACGLDWEPACLDFHRTRRSIRTSSVAQVREPLYNRSVDRWKNYESELVGLINQLPVT